MVWTDEMLIAALENELHLIRTMTTSVAGERIAPDDKAAAYLLCMALIRISAMVERLSPEWKSTYPGVCWEDIWSVGSRYAKYPLSVDMAEMDAFAETMLPEFYEQILLMLDECRDTIPY